MAIAVGSAVRPMRAKPPGITCQPLGVRARNTRTLIGRGTSRPSTKAGVVESVTASCPTRRAPSASSQAAMFSRAAPRNWPPCTVGSSVSKGRRVE